MSIGDLSNAGSIAPHFKDVNHRNADQDKTDTARLWFQAAEEFPFLNKTKCSREAHRYIANAFMIGSPRRDQGFLRCRSKPTPGLKRYLKLTAPLKDRFISTKALVEGILRNRRLQNIGVHAGRQRDTLMRHSLFAQVFLEEITRLRRPQHIGVGMLTA
jgi:hypothetical protein